MARTLPEQRDEIVVIPDGRWWRATAVLLGLWLLWPADLRFLREWSTASLLLFVPLWTAGLIVGVTLLLWTIFGKERLSVGAEGLTLERRIGRVSILRPRTYPLDVLETLHVQKRVRKIEAHVSTQYTLQVNGPKGTEEVLWRRNRAEAETLKNRLLELAAAPRGR